MLTFLQSLITDHPKLTLGFSGLIVTLIGGWFTIRSRERTAQWQADRDRISKINTDLASSDDIFVNPPGMPPFRMPEPRLIEKKPSILIDRFQRWRRRKKK